MIQICMCMLVELQMCMCMLVELQICVTQSVTIISGVLYTQHAIYIIQVLQAMHHLCHTHLKSVLSQHLVHLVHVVSPKQWYFRTHTLLFCTFLHTIYAFGKCFQNFALPSLSFTKIKKNKKTPLQTSQLSKAHMNGTQATDYMAFTVIKLGMILNLILLFTIITCNSTWKMGI